MSSRPFRNFAHFEEWLGSKGMFHMDMGLSRMRHALAQASLPHYPIVQVLGTNGKGSTSTFLAALSHSNGLNTGTYLSPHFVSIKERILVNGEQLADETWVECANLLANTIDFDALTYFEALTLLAVAIFAQANVELAVFEAGLGGAHDATTALDRDVQCYTPIAMDHTGVLGASLAAITLDKARAMSFGGRVFSAPQFPLAARLLEHEAEMRRCPLSFVGQEILPFLGMAGKTQHINASLALACWQWWAETFHVKRYPEKERVAFKHAFIPGRMEFRKKTGNHPDLILDGAHNPHAIQALLRQLPAKPETIIFSALADKDWETSLGLLSRLEVPVLIPQLRNSRAADVELMARESPYATAITGPRSLEEALGRAGGLTLICGSLYLLANFYELFPRKSP